MKKMTNSIKMLVAGGLLLSVMFLNSCSKNQQNAAITAQDNGASDKENFTAGLPPLEAWWTFDSTWTESLQSLTGTGHNDVTYTATSGAYNGKAAFWSEDSGYVSYDDAGTLNNGTSGFGVDFWLYAYPKEGGAQCVYCLPQTGAFWPTHHFLLDSYNPAQGDSGLIKIMFKANKPIPYNEQWNVVGGIPNFYNQWTHIQYKYNGFTSKFTLLVNDVMYLDHITLYTDDPMLGGVPLGNVEPNPGPHGALIGAFQNTWDPVLFGTREVWMLGFKGKIDQLKVYKF